MDVRKGVPILADLSKIDLAKILPSLELITLSEGDLLGGESPGGAVYCIQEGCAEVVAEVGDEVVLLLALGPGDTFGPLAGDGPVHPHGRVRAKTPVSLVRIPRSLFKELCERYPSVAQAVSTQLIHRISDLEKELIRAKLLLAAHAHELWDTPASEVSGVDVSERDIPLQVAASTHVSARDPADAPHSVPGEAGGRLDLTWLFKWIAAGSLLLVVAVHLWVGLEPSTAVLTVLIWGAVNWYLGFMPDYGVALGMVASLTVMQIAPAEVTLAGYTNETWFLVMGIYGLGAAMNRTGLLYRASLFVLRRLPPTYRGQSLALALTGLLLTPALPSSNGRVTMASPLAHELATAMRLPPRSAKRMGLALSVLHGFGQMFFMFMNGTGNCLVVWALLPPEVRNEVTWTGWLILALPLGLIVFIGFFAVLMWAVPSDGGALISRRVLELQAATLGPMNLSERMTVYVTAALLVGFVLQPFHGIHPSWLAIGSLLALMPAQIVDRQGFVTRVDWATLILFGALWSLAGIIRHAGLDVEMGLLVTHLLEPVAIHPWLFLIVLGLVTYGVRLLVPWEAAIPLMMVATAPVLEATGINAFVGGLVILATSNPFFVPQQNVVYLTVYQGTGEEDITHWQAARFGLYHAVITLVGIAVSALIWQATGVIYG